MLKLQDLITFNERTETQVEETGTVVAVPALHEVRSQTRKRKKPAREHFCAKQKQTVLNHKMVGTVINKKAQRIGLSQDLSIGDCVAEVQGKYNGKCGFCTEWGHRYTNCDLWKEKCENAMEYQLTSEHPPAANALKARLRGHMPLVNVDSKGAPIGKISKKMNGLNFVIHAACERAGQLPGSIESLNYNVTFINVDGTSMSKHSKIWVTGDVMADMVSAGKTRKKVKFVFDETCMSAGLPPGSAGMTTEASA